MKKENIQIGAEVVKMGAGLVVGHGVKNVVYKSLGWTVGEFVKPRDKMVTAIGVWAIGALVTNAAYDMIGKTVDSATDVIADVIVKIEEIKAGTDAQEDVVEVSDEEEE